MEKSYRDLIIEAAYEKGVEVVWAEGPRDIKRTGLHLGSPRIEELVKALEVAMSNGLSEVIIHVERGETASR